MALQADGARQGGFLLEFLGRSESLALFHRLRCVCHDLLFPLFRFSLFGSGLPYCNHDAKPLRAVFRQAHIQKERFSTRGSSWSPGQGPQMLIFFCAAFNYSTRSGFGCEQRPRDLVGLLVPWMVLRQFVEPQRHGTRTEGSVRGLELVNCGSSLGRFADACFLGRDFQRSLGAAQRAQSPKVRRSRGLLLFERHSQRSPYLAGSLEAVTT